MIICFPKETLVCLHKKGCVQLNQLQLEKVLHLVFAEIQITACDIHYCKVMDFLGALIRNLELIASYVIICFFHGKEVFRHKTEKEACSAVTFDKRDE